MTTRRVDNLFVRGNAPASTSGLLSFGKNEVACALGRSGISDNKQEGDGVTPSGQWPFRKILYRPDRIAHLESHLPIIPLEPKDGWCDAPSDPAYNCMVELPYPASAEHLWRDDSLYDIIVVLGHNDDPVVPGNGSAIFFHIAGNDYPPTEGCVAVSLSDMLSVLKCCGPETTMIISAE